MKWITDEFLNDIDEFVQMASKLPIYHSEAYDYFFCKTRRSSTPANASNNVAPPLAPPPPLAIATPFVAPPPPSAVATPFAAPPLAPIVIIPLAVTALTPDVAPSPVMHATSTHTPPPVAGTTLELSPSNPAPP
ncbi:proline-rich receptor-like protein kinase PERK2, partial [Phalaenopsis equestris]|uniref:proline-rich receptor-like protein kinase PERK2 n=1 Tax=Phalaenopsis equestris TaxID=78828 RepID=UPI0009E2005B